MPEVLEFFFVLHICVLAYQDDIVVLFQYSQNYLVQLAVLQVLPGSRGALLTARR